MFPKQYRRYVALAVHVLVTVGAILAVIEGALPKGNAVAGGVAIAAGLISQGLVVLRFIEGESNAQVANIHAATYTAAVPVVDSPDDDAVKAELGA